MYSMKRLSIMLAVVAVLPVRRPLLLILAILLYVAADADAATPGKTPVRRT